MEPLILKPVCKDYIWGGTRLKNDYKLPTDLDKVAEGWMLAAHREGDCPVENGEYKGKTVTEVSALLGKRLLGEKSEGYDRFPLLIKLIDAARSLSIQVHPNDEYAMKNENELGKNEMWYVVDAEPGSSIYYGFNRDVTPQELAEAIRNDTVTDLLRRVPVKKGDLFYINAGTVHAICEGILIAEVQQNSYVTYRLYDYGRLGADGRPRQLHIEKACDVACLKKETRTSDPDCAPEPRDGYTYTLLKKSDYFTVSRYCIDKSAPFSTDGSSFIHLLVLEGEGILCYQDKRYPLKKGSSVLLPAEPDSCTVEGCCELIASSL